MEVPGQRSMRQYQETEEKGRVCHSAPYNKTEVGELLHGLSAVVFETVRDVLTHGGPERCPVVWFAIQCEHKSTTANKDEKANVDESNRTKFTANLLARLLKDFLGHFLKRRLERIQHLGRSFLAVSTWRRCSVRAQHAAEDVCDRTDPCAAEPDASVFAAGGAVGEVSVFSAEP
eukprot:1839673-Rhodomonas_salina.1